MIQLPSKINDRFDLEKAILFFNMFLTFIYSVGDPLSCTASAESNNNDKNNTQKGEEQTEAKGKLNSSKGNPEFESRRVIENNPELTTTTATATGANQTGGGLETEQSNAVLEQLRKEAFEDVLPTETFVGNQTNHGIEDVDDSLTSRGNRKNEEKVADDLTARLDHNSNLEPKKRKSDEEIDEKNSEWLKGGLSAKEDDDNCGEGVKEERAWLQLRDSECENNEEKKLMAQLQRLKLEGEHLTRQRLNEIKSLEKTQIEVERQNREVRETWKNLYYEEKAKTQSLQLRTKNAEEQLQTKEKMFLGAVRKTISTADQQKKKGVEGVGNGMGRGKWRRSKRGVVHSGDFGGCGGESGKNWLSTEKSPLNCFEAEPLFSKNLENKQRELRRSIYDLKERIANVLETLENELGETKALRQDLKWLRDTLRETKINISLTMQQNKHIATMYGAEWIDNLTITPRKHKAKLTRKGASNVALLKKQN